MTPIKLQVGSERMLCYAKQRINAKMGIRFYQSTKVYCIFITIRNMLLKKLVINFKHYVLM